MKKKALLICAFAALCCAALLMFISQQPQIQLHINNDNSLMLTIHSNGTEKKIYPYENSNDGKSYFFLPSYVKTNTISVAKLNNKEIEINGEKIKSHVQFNWSDTESYDIAITASDGSVLQQYQTSFMKSANLPAIFIDTDSGSMEYLHKNKNNEEGGSISIIEESGNMEYSAKLDRISGRGNSSWDAYPKKPYAIKLKTPKALLGMDAGKKWCLLPVWREEVRMSTRLAFDIANELGLEFTPECKWIDLYLNGEYNGNYLLCEAVAIGDGRVEINNLEKENKANNPDILEAANFTEDSYKGYELTNGDNIDGGYLVEKDYFLYYNEDNAGFLTDSGYCFTLKSPEHASREQVEYIREYFQTIENMIVNGEPDYDNYIDLDSFAARFLVDEISLNFDTNVTSMYFYKEKNSNLLYAGPVWDYDSSMGWGKLGSGEWADYEQTTLNVLRDEELNWYQLLFQNETFYNQVITDYEKLLPYMETLIESTIDEYANTVQASTLMDETRWQNSYIDSNERGHYETFDNNVRYLKFFLAKRLNYLCNKWQIPYKEFTTYSTGIQHEITFVHDGEVVETRLVMDGEELTDLPYLDEEKYFGWSWYNVQNKVYRGKLPIYEDCTFYAREK